MMLNTFQNGNQILCDTNQSLEDLWAYSPFVKLGFMLLVLQVPGIRLQEQCVLHSDGRHRVPCGGGRNCLQQGKTLTALLHSTHR